MISWTIYDHPYDYPNSFVARQFDWHVPTNNVLLAKHIDTLRTQMRQLGLVRMPRAPQDEKAIVETWI